MDNDEQVTVHREVVYATVPGFRPLELDLYIGARPVALCVWLHGGGWRMGSRRNGPGPAGTGQRELERMAARGLAVASVEYRLSGEAAFPAPLDDVVAACTFLRTSADRLGIGDLPLVLWGTSAGGHLAGLCALSAGGRPDISAVASWSAPVDLLALPDDLDAIGELGDRGPTSREAQFLGTVPADDPDLARTASPITHVHAGAPPFLLVHGTEDRNVPVAQTTRYAAAFAAAGATARTLLVDGADHFYGGISRADLDRVVDETTDFLISATRS